MITDYLETLRRLPDEAILYIASVPIIPSQSCGCICGRALEYAMLTGVSTIAEDWFTEMPIAHPELYPNGSFEAPCGITLQELARLYGGTTSDWWSLFLRIVEDAQRVEEAFTIRLEEALNA